MRGSGSPDAYPSDLEARRRIAMATCQSGRQIPRRAGPPGQPVPSPRTRTGATPHYALTAVRSGPAGRAPIYSCPRPTAERASS